MALSKHKRQLGPDRRCSEPDQIDEDHDPLLFEDLIVEKASS
jgi:hypothetical protein